MFVGARYLGQERCEFTLWAPFHKKVILSILGPLKKDVSMESLGNGYWRAMVEGVPEESRYIYDLGASGRRPDPASSFQPEGVHGASRIVDHNDFKWQESGWSGLDLGSAVIYELHTGTFTPEGTFAAIKTKLDHLKDLGVTALELMPVCQFPGGRNWGYDGVYPFSVQSTYGGPAGLKDLVNECHNKGLAVILDVVYNHLGPEGNYLWAFGPYFTDKYSTAWGKAINFDDEGSHGVRNFFVENALFWFEHYRIDGLRLDAVHGIFDSSPKHILKEVSERVNAFAGERGRKLYVSAESDLNDPVLVRSWQDNGFGLDAQWCDDYHHSLHALVTSEKSGYYRDFGSTLDLEKSLREGFVYDGKFSQFRKKGTVRTLRMCPRNVL